MKSGWMLRLGIRMLSATVGLFALLVVLTNVVFPISDWAGEEFVFYLVGVAMFACLIGGPSLLVLHFFVGRR